MRALNTPMVRILIGLTAWAALSFRVIAGLT